MICYKDKTWCINDKCRKRGECPDYANTNVCKDAFRSGLHVSTHLYNCVEPKPKRAKSKLKGVNEK